MKPFAPLPALAAALAVLGIGPVASFAATDQCRICHPQQRVAFESSIHAREEVSCVSCHRGDAASRDEKQAHGGDFRALSDRRGIPEACGDCHSDLEKMRPYNLPVDQLAIYGTSQHGKALARGDTSVAVCIDCHGSHEVLSPHDPKSGTFPTNLPGTCGRCHGDEKLMEDHGLDPEVVDKYRASVHGHALLEGGNLAAPTCVSCHGVHGATPPGFGDIDRVCGACHDETRRAYLAGPHHTLGPNPDLPQCSSCHSNHLIERYEVSEIAGLCSDCHDAGTNPAQMGEKLQTMIEGARSEIGDAERLALSGQQAALDIEDYLGRLEEANTLVTEALSLVHTATLEPVESVTRRARSIGEEVKHDIYGKLDHRERHIGLAVFWFYVVMTIVILVSLKRRTVRSRAS